LHCTLRIFLDFDSVNCFLDLQEGMFIDHQPVHPHFIEGEKAALTSQLLKVMQPYELEEFTLNHIIRRQLLLHFHDYYALHIPEFGQMKTLMVLHEVL
jgi:DNA repair protein RecO (recombination protein O)